MERPQVNRVEETEGEKSRQEMMEEAERKIEKRFVERMGANVKMVNIEDIKEHGVQPISERN